MILKRFVYANKTLYTINGKRVTRRKYEDTCDYNKASAFLTENKPNVTIHSMVQ